MVRVLVIESNDRGFIPGLELWIFKGDKKSAAHFPSEGM
jgi:hypothetical protein